MLESSGDEVDDVFTAASAEADDSSSRSLKDNDVVLNTLRFLQHQLNTLENQASIGRRTRRPNLEQVVATSFLRVTGGSDKSTRQRRML